MKKLNRLHNKLLSGLLKANGKLDSFTLFKRSRVSFSEFSLSMRILSDRDLVVEDDNNNILLTRKGKGYIVAIPSLQDEKPTWREFPEKLKTSSITIEEPYIPNIKLLDKRTFHIE